MNIAVIFAGGKGVRMGHERPKQFIEVYDKPIIIHTLEKFEEHDEIDAIYISCIKDWISHLTELIKQYKITKVKKIVPGGTTGQLSIYNGLVAAYEEYPEKDNIVLIHDGVRPFIDSDLISRNIEAVKKYGSAVSSSPAIETFAITKEDGQVETIVDRNKSMVAKAPQSFYLSEIMEVHKQALKDGVDNSIDSCSLLYSYGKKIHTISCSTDNIKITTPKDLYISKYMFDIQNDTYQVEGKE